MALINANKFEEFYALKEEIRKKTFGQPGRRDKKTADKWAWKEAAAQFSAFFNRDAFDTDYRQGLSAKRAEQGQRKREIKKRKVVSGTSTENAVLHAAEVIEFTFGEDDSIDVLRDVKWVYQNMHRLIKKNQKTGLSELDMDILKQAPSAGSVGIANYAMSNPKEFYEKYVVKILPRDEEKPLAKTEDELKAELDPSFDDVEKYMKKLTPAAG